MIRRVRTCLVAILTLVVLAACDGSTDDDVEPTSSGSLPPATYAPRFEASVPVAVQREYLGAMRRYLDLARAGDCEAVWAMTGRGVRSEWESTDRFCTEVVPVAAVANARTGITVDDAGSPGRLRVQFRDGTGERGVVATGSAALTKQVDGRFIVDSLSLRAPPA